MFNLLMEFKRRGGKYRKIFLEFFLNVIAFSLLIFSQQIIAFPLISRNTETEIFGRIILTFGIGNIVISMFGSTIGLARLLDNKQYNKKYISILVYCSLLVMIIAFVIYYILFNADLLGCILFSIVCLLGNIRNFLVSEYRITDEHNWIFKQNFVYFLGLLIGCLTYYFYKNWVVIFFFSELLSVSYCLYNLVRDGFIKRFKDTSKLKLGNMIQLMFNTGLSYSLNQYDRLIIYPILGAAKVSLYFSVNTTSRMGSLIMNPMSNYILGKLSNNSRLDKKKGKIILLFALGLMILYFLVLVITTPLLIKFLYPTFYDQIHTILIPVCIGAAISSGNSILKPIVMKRLGVKIYNKYFIIYSTVLVVSSLIMGVFYDLIGFAFANIISSAFLFTILSSCMKKSFK